MQTFSKYVTDLLVTTSESFEPSKSWKKMSKTNKKTEKNIQVYNQVSMMSVTLVAGSFFRPQRFF